MKTELSGLPSAENGLTVEHILLSITVVSTKESAGQFDDSCARIIERGLMEYHGVKTVEAKVQYQHTKIENHFEGCECHHCKPPVSLAASLDAERATTQLP